MIKPLYFPALAANPLKAFSGQPTDFKTLVQTFPAKGKRKVKARAEAKPDRTEIQIQANPSQKHSQTRAKAKA